MKILVLGGSGYLGRGLIHALLNSQVNYKISSLSRVAGTFKAVNYIEADYRDVHILEPALKGQDMVYHLISESLPFSSWHDPAADIELNLLPFIRFLDLCIKQGVKKVVFISSAGGVYGSSLDVWNESSAVKPFIPYGIIKHTMENFLRHAWFQGGLDSYILRVSNVYGPGQQIAKGLGFINTALEAAITKKPIKIFGDGLNKRDYIFVEDLSRILLPLNLSKLQVNEVYNIASGEYFSQLEIIDRIEKLMGIAPKIEYLNSRASDVKCVQPDNTKLKSRIPEIIFTELQEGLKKTYETLKATL